MCLQVSSQELPQLKASFEHLLEVFHAVRELIVSYLQQLLTIPELRVLFVP